jgi:hypothetical protein
LDCLLTFALWTQDQEVESQRQQGDEDQGCVLLHSSGIRLWGAGRVSAAPMKLFAPSWAFF